MWEVKDPLLASGSGLDYDYQEDNSSNFHAGGYNQGGHTGSLVGGVSGQQLYGGAGKPPAQGGGYAGGGNGGRAYPPNLERY